MKKITAATIVIIAFVVYGFIQTKSQSASVNTTTVSNTNTASSSNNTTVSSTPSSSDSTFKDGTYTGSAADAIYGNIQVKATISGGKLTDVTFLQYPTDENHSVEINQQADPILAQEAIQAQSSQVDTVSGATDTSEAFVQSLSSALDQAKS